MAHFPWDIIVLAVIALFIVGMLYRVLGRKVGMQGSRQQENYKIMAHVEKVGRRQTGTNTVQPPPLPGSVQVEAEQTEYVLPKVETPLGESLSKVATLLPEFQGRTFLKNVEKVFIDTVKAFAKADHEALKKTLAPHVFSVFAQVLAKRQESQETLFVDLKRIERLEITDVLFQQDEAVDACLINVMITSWQVRHAKDAQGEIIEGTESLTEFKDSWKFAYNEKWWQVAETAVA